MRHHNLRKIEVARRAATSSTESERKQARAQQRKTSRSQRQETVGDKVMIAHDTPFESVLVGV
jgi:hypothetical protein